MKNLVAFAALISLSAGGSTILVPGDNSHYVEGESRYIWMPDGDGVPHLVDLHEPVDNTVLSTSGANNQYWLYTRQNSKNHQILSHNNVNSVSKSNYVASRPLVVFVYGWGDKADAGTSALVRDAFLAVLDCNLIVLDWRTVANSGYVAASRGVPNVGKFLGEFLVWLLNTAGGNWDNVHLVGFSLGAHVVGNAGRFSGKRVGRITGLDPAGPLWKNSRNAMNRSDGQYVEAIHTDGGVLGIFDPIGAANFYPNGGKNRQPGCLLSNCSHGRSVQYFVSSVRTNHFVGKLCSNLNQVSNNQCTGSTLNMGNGIPTKRGQGLYRVNTRSSWPF